MITPFQEGSEQLDTKAHEAYVKVSCYAHCPNSMLAIISKSVRMHEYPATLQLIAVLPARPCQNAETKLCMQFLWDQGGRNVVVNGCVPIQTHGGASPIPMCPVSHVWLLCYILDDEQ